MVVCIWLLICLSILSVSIGKVVSSQINFSRYYLDGEQSYYLTLAALKQAMVERDNDSTPTYDTLFELRTLREIAFGVNTAEYALIDEESKVNINYADIEILEELLGSYFLADDLVEYRKENTFTCIEELLNMTEIDQGLFRSINEHITVHGQGSVNINTASKQVLLALGCSQDSCKKILGYRGGEDGRQITPDDAVFDSSQTISRVLQDLSIDCQHHKLFTSKSSNYTLKTQPRIGKRLGEGISVTFSAEEIKSWRRNSL